LFSVSQFSFEEGELVISSLLWVGSAFSLPVSQYQTFAALQKVGKGLAAAIGMFLMHDQSGRAND
jgi:hypothetical protein